MNLLKNCGRRQARKRYMLKWNRMWLGLQPSWNGHITLEIKISDGRIIILGGSVRNEM